MNKFGTIALAIFVTLMQFSCRASDVPQIPPAAGDDAPAPASPKQQFASNNLASQKISPSIYFTVNNSSSNKTNAIAKEPHSDATRIALNAVSNGSLNLVVLPDTQYYSQQYPATYNTQTIWISNNWDKGNFDFVVHLGDIVNHAGDEQEWRNAHYAMSLLDKHPYTVLPGNHDYEYVKDRNHDYTYFNKYFTTDILIPHLNKGMFPAGTMINNYVEVKGYLILSIGFYYELDNTLRQWITSVLSQNSHLPVIVVTHDFLLASGELSKPGKELWSTLGDFSNVFLVLSGHAVMADKLDKQEKINKLTGTNGNTIYAVVSNYQDYMRNNSGYIRIYEITNNHVDVKTFSPLLNTYMVDKSSQFTLAREVDRNGK